MFTLFWKGQIRKGFLTLPEFERGQCPSGVSLPKSAMDAASIVVFGQRPQALSGKRRRGPRSPSGRRYSA